MSYTKSIEHLQQIVKDAMWESKTTKAINTVVRVSENLENYMLETIPKENMTAEFFKNLGYTEEDYQYWVQKGTEE